MWEVIMGGRSVAVRVWAAGRHGYHTSHPTCFNARRINGMEGGSTWSRTHGSQLGDDTAMDFWSRLLSPLSAGSTQEKAKLDPAKRLHRFEKEYSNLLTIWRRSNNLSQDSEAAEQLEIRLQELTNILSDESRRPLPHPCIQYASIKQIYAPIGKIATISYNEWIIKEAVLFFATLIESEEEAFVENHSFSSSLTNLLVRITGINSVRLGLDTESRLVELAFNITTKIRLDPNILPAWFKPQSQKDDTRGDRDKFAGRTQKADFPLFYILMDYIHHEGKVGDFARTGLLYIIEAASRSAQLEQWIVESDLSTLMATGLGALYSQLSRKLVIDHLPHDLPPILALSDYEHPEANYEITSSCSPEFQSHLETFLSHLIFWQDVLNHCKSVEVKTTLLEHFQIIFLQQLLYPSLLESSDIDGGSSVAVLTYLRRILESLDHPDMINLILHYLLALPNSLPVTDSDNDTSVSEARKRKSMNLASMMAKKTDTSVTPLLFNLVDLILACLRSQNGQTIHVTLQLVSAILKRHHRYAVITLLRTEIVPKTRQRTVGAHEQEIEYLMYMAGLLGGLDTFDETYQSVLGDTMTRLESHPCSLKLVAPRASIQGPGIADSLPGAPRAVREHTLRPDDPLLNAMVDLLETFFLNPVETNLSVTETLVGLGICGYMSIEGWLCRHPDSYTYEEPEAEADDLTSPISDEAPVIIAEEIDPVEAEEREHIRALEKCRRRPQWKQDTLPRIFQTIKHLCEQVVTYKETIPRFEELVQQRRAAFMAADSILDQPPPPPIRKDAPQFATPERPSADGLSRSGSPSRPSGIEGFAQRLLSELGTPSRTGSPRGRKEPRSSGTASPAGPFSLPKSGNPFASAAPSTPKEQHNLSPRDTSAAATPWGGFPRSQSPQQQYVEPRDAIVDSQASAFAAIDQTILARRVGPPDTGTRLLRPIPLNFDKQPLPDPVVDADRETDDEYETATETAADFEEAASTRPSSPPPPEHTASVSHIVTNVIIFQSFIMELASLMQVRAGLFDEVRYI
ncbi:Retinoic acid induced 16-like protein-domain-containing protein [Stachybotrys elegans]|uniref:Retinoic acid induced 16-like protein-domain-containing protein n=1 Tax=Stachybotrys elegans TaxID=80388 RepID=A0A8K0SJR8_9HYPO|nr:Retinoic acid induced 16-like protein-domain-containing protein [Stachybotrys elegans]